RGRRSARWRRRGVYAASRLNGLVPGAADGADQPRPAELAAELPDVDVDRARAAGIREAPDPVEEAVAREDDSHRLDEVSEQVELLRGQLDRAVADRDLAPVDVDDDVAEPKG